MLFENAYFIIGNAYAGKSTMARLLAQKHNGILCGENWHDSYPERLDPGEFPGLTYTRDLKDWRDFIRRTPEEYKAWIDETARECEILELKMLPEICKKGGPVFVDTNISAETLKDIAPCGHVLVMLAEPEVWAHSLKDTQPQKVSFCAGLRQKCSKDLHQYFCAFFLAGHKNLRF